MRRLITGTTSGGDELTDDEKREALDVVERHVAVKAHAYRPNGTAGYCRYTVFADARMQAEWARLLEDATGGDLTVREMDKFGTRDRVLGDRADSRLVQHTR